MCVSACLPRPGVGEKMIFAESQSQRHKRSETRPSRGAAAGRPSASRGRRAARGLPGAGRSRLGTRWGVGPPRRTIPRHDGAAAAHAKHRKAHGRPPHPLPREGVGGFGGAAGAAGCPRPAGCGPRGHGEGGGGAGGHGQDGCTAVLPRPGRAAHGGDAAVRVDLSEIGHY